MWMYRGLSLNSGDDMDRSAVDTGTVNGKYWIFALGMKVMLGAFFFEKGGI